MAPLVSFRDYNTSRLWPDPTASYSWALYVAEKCEVPPSFLACLRAYALGQLAHARRAVGEAKAAETCWQEAWTLWRDGDPHVMELLPKRRLIELEAWLLPGDGKR